MVPMRTVKMKLGRADTSDATWLAQTLNRICRPFGTHVDRREGGFLELGWGEQGMRELSKREGGEHATTRR